MASVQSRMEHVPGNVTVDLECGLFRDQILIPS